MKTIRENIARIVERLESIGGWDDAARDILITAIDDQIQLLRMLQDRKGVFKVLWYGTILDYWQRHPAEGS